MEFKEGDRVIFSKDTRDYGAGRGNPLQGTKWACVGTVYRIDDNDDDVPIKVRWDNGSQNCYHPSTLEFEFNLPEVSVPSLSEILGA